MIPQKRVIGLCIAAICSGRASAQSATTPPADKATATIEEIVVTAQRRSENLQNVPIAVTAITGAQLARGGVRDLSDLKIAVPSLNLTSSAGYLSTSLRGVGSNAFGPNVENPIALYIDGVYYAAGNVSLMNLNNVAQVEVLKGPQGTLFGRNATGGLIQISTRDPGPTATGDFQLGYGNYDTLSGSAYVGGPLAEHVFMDVAVSGTHQGDGFGTNRFNGQDVYRIDHAIATRSKLIVEPGANTKLTLIGDYENTKDSLQGYYVYRGTKSGFTPNAGAYADLGYDISNNVQPLNRVKAYGGSLRIDQRIGGANLMSVTAYRHNRSYQPFDFDASPANAIGALNIETDHQFSQELQLSSPSSGKLKWVAGLYYFYARASYVGTTIFDPFDGFDILVNTIGRTRSYAGYAQASYEIADRTNLTIGGRYTSERRLADGSTDFFFFAPPLGAIAGPVVHPRAKFDKFTFRASLDHRFSDQLLAYASFNRGFKAGGFNLSDLTVPGFRPETLDAYEVGFKSDLADRRVRFNVSAFYYDYADVQVQLLGLHALYITNGAKARDYGLDADLTVQASRDLRLSAGVSWISPKFRSFPGCLISTAIGGTASTPGNCAGEVIPLAAKFTGNIGADYKHEFDSGRLDLNANLYHSSGFYFEPDNVLKQGSYSFLNASIKYTFTNGMSVGAFGKNINNARVVNYVTTSPAGLHISYYQAPRTFGGFVGYKF